MKRFLSLVIALAMIISLFPAVSAGSETETNNISMTYDLKTILNAPFAPKYPLTNLTYQLTGGLFKFAESSLANDAPDGSPFWYGGVANSRFFKMNNNEFVSFEISIPKDGEYSMDVTHQRAKNGTTVDVYVTDAETFYDAPFTAAKAADFDLYGSYDTYNADGANDFAGSNTDWVTSEDVFAGKKLLAGKYVITFHISNVANKRGCVSTFSLTAGDGSEVTLVNTLIDSFENDKVNLSAYKTDGSVLDLAEIDVSYESDDEEVATVDTQGNITKHKPGTTNITATVTYNGVTVSDTKELFVSDGGLTVIYDLARHLTEGGFTYADTASRPLSAINHDLTNKFYRVIDSSTGEKYVASDIGYAVATYKFLKIKEGKYVSIEVDVPKEGTYTLITDYQKAKDGSLVNVYVTEADKFSSSSKGSLKGSYDCSGGSKNMSANGTEWKNNYSVATDLVLPAKKHVITFEVPANAATGSQYGMLTSFSLVSGDGKGKALMSIGFDNINSGTALTGYMSDGSVATEDELSVIENITYDSSNKSVATVDENGVITDVAGGQTEITATAKVGEREIVATGTYTSIVSDRE